MHAIIINIFFFLCRMEKRNANRLQRFPIILKKTDNFFIFLFSSFFFNRPVTFEKSMNVFASMRSPVLTCSSQIQSSFTRKNVSNASLYQRQIKRRQEIKITLYDHTTTKFFTKRLEKEVADVRDLKR